MPKLVWSALVWGSLIAAPADSEPWTNWRPPSPLLPLLPLDEPPLPLDDPLLPRVEAPLSPDEPPVPEDPPEVASPLDEPAVASPLDPEVAFEPEAAAVEPVDPPEGTHTPDWQTSPAPQSAFVWQANC